MDEDAASDETSVDSNYSLQLEDSINGHEETSIRLAKICVILSGPFTLAQRILAQKNQSQLESNS
jgi:hypothetical protein